MWLLYKKEALGSEGVKYAGIFTYDSTLDTKSLKDRRVTIFPKFVMLSGNDM